jgi:hypothetical protein
VNGPICPSIRDPFTALANERGGKGNDETHHHRQCRIRDGEAERASFAVLVMHLIVNWSKVEASNLQRLVFVERDVTMRSVAVSSTTVDWHAL